ncbi:MAG: putative 2-aminoethylphosphonate ABC transporter permease subunit [Rhodospirillaceae bacterium]
MNRGGAPVVGLAIGRQRLDRDEWLMRCLLWGFVAAFLFILIVPLYMLTSRSFHDASDAFIGFKNYHHYFTTPALFQSVGNSFFVAGTSAAIVTVIAFVYAYALTRTQMPFKSFFKVMAFIPLLSPSVVKAIALVYWFGNQGVLKELLFGHSIYGPIGIIFGSVLCTFPHVILIIMTALALADGRLYEAAASLKAGRVKTFITVTLPGARYGLISAAIVAFILVLTDFGVPKIIGGNYNVLATDIYKEVVGQQNFEMGAVVSVLLLIPAVIAFAIDRVLTRKQHSSLTARSVPYVPKKSPIIDYAMFAFCLTITVFTLAVLGMAQFAALVKFWPYNLELTFDNYVFDAAGVGWENFYNSLKAATLVSIFGTAIIFVGAYVVEKSRRDRGIRQVVQLMALMPMAIPGLVLGLSHLMFINHPDNPLGFLYGGMTIIVVSTIIHFYTVTHLTATASLKQLDSAFESVSASMKISAIRMFFRVTVPLCLPAILDIAIYLFLATMTTVSGVIFIYGPDTKVASIAAIHMDELGEQASAAAMAMLIVYACVVVRLLHLLVSRVILKHVQQWRMR